ncbi:MAG: hypothetical protein ACRDJO_11655, partial [Actinomycetota bacterium]
MERAIPGPAPGPGAPTGLATPAAPVRAGAFGVYATVVFAGLGAVVGAGILGGRFAEVSPSQLVFWLIACASSNLLPAPVTPNVQLTMSSPINLAIAFLFPGPVAAAMVAIASVTDWEISRETTVLRAAFNRSQLALSTAVAAWIFALGERPGRAIPSLWVILGAVVVYHLANQTFVALAERFARGVSPREAFGRILLPLPSFLGSYLILGFLGMTFALTY